MKQKDTVAFRQKILDLLKTHRQGEYWSFYPQWHEDIKMLLLDILCFANTVHDKDCYLIFGVDAQGHPKNIAASGRSQEKMEYILGRMPWAGHHPPEIAVDAMEVEGSRLEILTVFDSAGTPYFLEQTAYGIDAGQIYTCRGDTGKQKGIASYQETEDLWKKHFGLLKTPLDYIYDRFKSPGEWKMKNAAYYNVFKPEYHLQLVENREVALPEFYAYAMNDACTFYKTLYIKSGAMSLGQHAMVLLDRGKYLTPVPDWGFICFGQYKNDYKYEYKYLVKDSAAYQIYSFFLARATWAGREANRRFMEVILMYHSEEERREFESYAERHQEELEARLKTEHRFSHIYATNRLDTQVCRKRLHLGLCLNELLKQFREEREKN